MLVEEALFQLLSGSADVSPLVGTRIYPGSLPTVCVYPALTYRLVHRAMPPTVSDPATGPVESQFIFYAVGKGATDYADSKRLDDAVRLCLQGFSGVITRPGSFPPDSIRIQGIFFDDAEEDFDLVTATRQAMSLFHIWHSQISH